MYDYSKVAAGHRQRAEQFRTIAAGVKDEVNRKRLLRIADDFDRLAVFAIESEAPRR
jgi:hypothetical protein